MDGKPNSKICYPKVIVIGGGLAGLAAACHLADSGLEVTLLEKQDQLGGRASSFFHPETRQEVDTGQHVFMRCCTYYLEFLEKLGISYKTNIQSRLMVKVFSGKNRGNKIGSITSARLPAPFHLLPSLLSYPYISFGERLAVIYGALRILFTRRSRQKDLRKVTFYTWLKKHGQSEKAITNLWNLIVLPTLNEDVYRASAYWGIMVFQEALLKRAHNADIGYSRVGLSQLVSSEAISYIKSRGGKVYTGRGARSLLLKKGRVEGVKLVDGDILEADLYLSSLPPDSALGLLPFEWRENEFFKQAGGMLWAPIVNVYITYDRAVMDEDFVAVLESHVQWVFNRSLINGNDSSNRQKIGISLSGAWEYISMSRSQLENLFIPELSQVFPRARGAKVLDFAVVKQRRATFPTTPGGERLRLSHRTPIDNFFLAGDWTDTGWPSTMEGAVRSGVNSALEVLSVVS